MIFPNVFEYTDYRKFLKDYYEDNKGKKPYFSYRYLSKKAGINASAFFKYVIEGKRGLPKSPPRTNTSIEGLWGKPTVLNNVETFACVPMIIRKGRNGLITSGRKRAKGPRYLL